MDIVSIQDDEWLPGYFGRLAAADSCFTAFELRRKLLKVVKSPALSGSALPNNFELISSELQIELKTLLHDHTLWRLHRAFRSEEQILKDGSELIPPKQLRFVAQQFRKSLWYCPSCADEDRKEPEFSYWRRSHQVPGVTHCCRHHVALIGITYEGLLNFTPDRFIDDPGLDRHSMPAVQGNDWISKVVGILHIVLESDSTANQEPVSRLLRTACGMDDANHKKDRQAAIAHDIASNLPVEWLSDYLARVRKIGDYTTVLSNVLASESKWQKKPAATTVALLAARYLSADEVRSMFSPTGFSSPS